MENNLLKPDFSQNQAEPKEDLGSKIVALRSQHNFSQEKLAEELNVSRQAISNWERNKAEPDFSTLCKICGIFGITVDELIKGGRKNMSQEISAKPKKRFSKYDIAIGLFYAIGIVLGFGIFFCVGLYFMTYNIWAMSLFLGITVALVFGLTAHAIILLKRKD